MPKISAVINTHNEEKNIRYCLETVKWCDEIIVVDMESEDRTVAIAREYTDKVFAHEKVLEFDLARKFAIEKATNEWILLIDADELIPVTLSGKLKATVRNNDVDAVMIPYVNFLMGAWNRHTGWWPDYHFRLFRKSAMNVTGQVHNFLHLRKDSRTVTLPAEEKYAIHHFAYRDSLHFIDKMNRYTTIESTHLHLMGSRFGYCRMFYSALKEFFFRFFWFKGYKDGSRGLFVSVMMSMYRILTFIKLWELYEYPEEGVATYYEHLKQDLINGYRD